MTISQLEYIVAVDRHRNFVKAAEACGVTQPTLSSMIQKLEFELDVVIFDRSSHPVKPTLLGEEIIKQAKVTLYNASQIQEIVSSKREEQSGELLLGIIPTVAPYILPKFFQVFRSKHPGIKMKVSETRTKLIVEQLERAELDMAILATPLANEGLLEIPLYYEKFVAYVSPSESLYAEEEILSAKMPTERLWVLQEGHCLRNQVFNFCHKQADTSSIYEAGSIDTLVKIVDANGGYTIIPELHIDLLCEAQRKNIRHLTAPAPVREISLVIRRDFVREKMLNIVADAVKAVIPEQMLDGRLKKFAIKL